MTTSPPRRRRALSLGFRLLAVLLAAGALSACVVVPVRPYRPVYYVY